jgi:ATP-dependent DNA helicase RecG
VLRRVEQCFGRELDEKARVREVTRALDALRPLAQPDWADAALARGTDVLPGIGPRRAEALARRDLRSISDLLFHLPTRYDDRRQLSSLGDLEVGRRATFVARVLVSDFVARRGRPGRRGGRMFEAVVGDDTGTVNLKWFHGGDAIASAARKGALLLVTGDVKRYRFSKEILHPEIERLADDADVESDDLARFRSVVPDYPTPESVHPRALRRAVQLAVEHYADLVAGHVPEALARERKLPGPAEALHTLHAPELDVDVEALRQGTHAARTRLVLEELYLLEVGLALQREARGHEEGVAIAGGEARLRAAREGLPFELTSAQARALDEILRDLERPHPMQRLLEGDVGSGKTAVAYLAAVAVAGSGHQTALMAPTELLAEQHARTLEKLAAAGPAVGLRVALLTSSVPRAQAEAVRRELAAGELDLVVGTHALLQESVSFHRLAFVVIDEQHRFGVRQRATLAGKSTGGRPPHTLVMTATPIPRTLALTAYGDLDLSVLDEMPPGRRPVRTVLLRAGEGRRAVDLLRETAQRGEQVYVVYPLVEESEKSDLRAARESAEKIAQAFPDLRVDLIHGRLDAAERAAAMARFETGETQVLVSTTVIEVGVDVPNATLMIVEHAERFGLAQLHHAGRHRGQRGAPGGAARDVRRLPHRRGRPEDPRPRRVPRHPPERTPARPQDRRPGARRAPGSRGPRGRAGDRVRRPGPAAPRRPAARRPATLGRPPPARRNGLKRGG